MHYFFAGQDRWRHHFPYEQLAFPIADRRSIFTYLRSSGILAAGRSILIPNNHRNQGNFIAAAHLAP
jgi:hypothetical protein